VQQSFIDFFPLSKKRHLFHYLFYHLLHKCHASMIERHTFISRWVASGFSFSPQHGEQQGQIWKTCCGRSDASKGPASAYKSLKGSAATARHPLSGLPPVQTKKNTRRCTCSPEARCWTKNWETKTSNLKKQPRKNKHLFGLPSGSAHIDGVSAFFIHKTPVIEMVIVVFQKWRKRLMYNVKNMLDPQQTARFEENNSLYFDKFIGKHFWIHQGSYEIRDHPLTPTPNQPAC
jgi:hypothetical protein